MEISYDAAKRTATLQHRGLDFEDAVHIFEGPEFTLADDRFDYGEERFQTYGLLEGRLIVLVWTPRSSIRHIISMRKANDRERKKYGVRVGRSG